LFGAPDELDISIAKRAEQSLESVPAVVTRSRLVAGPRQRVDHPGWIVGAGK
jgi:hypothetical protein